MRKQVFLSYRHETVEHSRAVFRLAELRQAAIPVALDQFYLDDNPGGPDEGWPKWCEVYLDKYTGKSNKDTFFGQLTGK
jgi:hypothetical protein